MAAEVSATGYSKATRYRFVILCLISGAVMINYLDRAVMSVSAKPIADEFMLDPAMMGLVLSAFGWSYCLAQLPSGILLDFVGTKIVYLLAIIGWSISTLLHAFTRNLTSLFSFRLLLGLTEAPCFPANSNIVGTWFPRSERARAIGVYTAAEYIGLGMLTPVMTWIISVYGWRSLFFISGSLGLLFAFAWFAGYHEPADSRANREEIKLIRAGGGREKSGGTKTFSWSTLGKLLAKKQMIALMVGQFAVYSTFVFFLTWFPTYLATERHMEWVKLGFFASLPYLAGFFGILFAGWLSDKLLKSGASLNVSRKVPVIMGLVGASTIVAANYVEGDNLVIAIMSLAFFSQAMSSSGWSVLSEIAPEGTLGMIGGLFNTAANLASIITPIVIGIIVGATHNFIGALVFVGGVAAVGALSWIFLIGDLKPMKLGT